MTNYSFDYSLVAAAQDIWHYCALISPVKGLESAFVGDRYHVGLIGKLRAYERIRDILLKLEVLEVKELVMLLDELPCVSGLETEAQLLATTKRIQEVLQTVCARVGIDAYSGEWTNKG